MESILMIGQSNMAGRGRLGEVEYIRSEGRLFVLRNGRWQPFSEPVNTDRSCDPDCDDGLPKCGISLAGSFIRDYANTYNVKAGLIPCADGGTKLAEWMPGEILFDHAVMQAKLAQRTSEIKGIIWHQGESDASDKDLVETYAERFIIMITEMKRQLDIENVPVIFGEAGYFLDPGHFKYAKLLNEKLREIADKNDLIGGASAEGLTDLGDRLHFDSCSSRIFGERYFKEYKRIKDKINGLK